MYNVLSTTILKVSFRFKYWYRVEGRISSLQLFYFSADIFIIVQATAKQSRIENQQIGNREQQNQLVELTLPVNIK